MPSFFCSKLMRSLLFNQVKVFIFCLLSCYQLFSYPGLKAFASKKDMLSLWKSEVWEEKNEKHKFSKMYEHLKRTRKTTYSLLQLTILFTTIYWYWGAKFIVLPPSFAWNFHFIFSTFAILVNCCISYLIQGWKKVEIFVVLKMVVHAILLFFVRWKHWIGQSAILKRLPTLSIRKWNDELNFVGYC
jgi:hypothetical protein